MATELGGVVQSEHRCRGPPFKVPLETSPCCATLLIVYPEVARGSHRGAQSSKSVLDRRPAQA